MRHTFSKSLWSTVFEPFCELVVNESGIRCIFSLVFLPLVMVNSASSNFLRCSSKAEYLLMDAGLKLHSFMSSLFAELDDSTIPIELNFDVFMLVDSTIPNELNFDGFMLERLCLRRRSSSKSVSRDSLLGNGVPLLVTLMKPYSRISVGIWDVCTTFLSSKTVLVGFLRVCFTGIVELLRVCRSIL